MKINGKNLDDMTDSKQSLLHIARMADEHNAMEILENNIAQYAVSDFKALDQMELASNEHVETVAMLVLDQNDVAFRKLAK